MFNPEELASVMEAQAALANDNPTARWVADRKRDGTNEHTRKQPVSEEVRESKRQAQRRARKTTRKNKR